MNRIGLFNLIQARLKVHLCFPLNKFSVFYQIQSKGSIASSTYFN